MSEIIGNIKLIGETKTFGSKGFRKPELVVTTTEEKYEQHISIDFVQDKCDELDKFNVGDQVKVNINILGRMWVNPEGEEKYFNSLQGWRIELIEGRQSEVDKYESANEDSHIPDNQGDGNDLPF